MFNIPIREASGPKEYELAVVKPSCENSDLSTTALVVFVVEKYFGSKDFFKVIPISHSDGKAWTQGYSKENNKFLVVNKNCLSLVSGHVSDNLSFVAAQYGGKNSLYREVRNYSNIAYYPHKELNKISKRLQELIYWID